MPSIRRSIRGCRLERSRKAVGQPIEAVRCMLWRTVTRLQTPEEALWRSGANEEKRLRDG